MRANPLGSENSKVTMSQSEEEHRCVDLEVLTWEKGKGKMSRTYSREKVGKEDPAEKEI